MTHQNEPPLPFHAVVMAAGQGKRMKSALPKVLHPLAGRPLAAYPIEAALEAGARDVVVVVGHGRDAVEAALGPCFGTRVRMAVQHEQRGTGDAARCGIEALEKGYDGWVVILNGDVPLLSADAVRSLLEAAAEGTGPLALLTGEVPDATGYGRILRDSRGRVVGIREERDCNDAERRIGEMNPGVYAVRADFFRRAIERLGTDNAQGELYLTDLVAEAARGDGASARVWPIDELHGVNDRFELAERERLLRLRIAAQHARNGVTLRDPASAFIDADVEIARDAHIEAHVHLRGRTRIGEGAHIDTGCVLQDVHVDAHAQLKPYTVATDSVIGENAQLGPFSHLRPASAVGPEAHVGNFVEMKKTTLGRGSKANHLAYLGDGDIGEGVNIGAGTIFCNYDGFNKHRTVLEDGAFIGSDSHLVAPVRVGKNAYVGTGTTVTQDVPQDALAIGRARQQNKPGMAARLRARLKAAKEAAKKAAQGQKD